jgi:Alginate export
VCDSIVRALSCLIGPLAGSAVVCAQPPVTVDAPRPEHGSTALTIFGQHRSRYESLDPQFDPTLGENDRALAMRTSLTLEAGWPRWQVVGELMDSRAELNDSDSTLTTSVVNTLEVQQLVARRSWKDILGAGSSSTLGIGRLTMDFGSRRLIARNAFRNTPNSFVGVDWLGHSASGRTFRAFYLVPMRARPESRRALLHNEQQVDDTEHRTHLIGLSYETPISNRGDRVNVYWIGLDAAPEVESKHIDTFGVRFDRSPVPGQLHYEVELMSQSGSSTGTVGGVEVQGLDHDAGFYHLELGYMIRAPMSPDIAVQYDFASGDDDPFDGRNERFDTLYGARSFELGWSGIYGPFARSNLETPGIRVSLEPTHEWQVELRLRDYRLASPRDVWTTTGLLDVSGQSGDSLGSQFDAAISWQPRGSRLRFGFGAARFSKGEFVRRTAPEHSRPSVYYYVETTVSFPRARTR